MVGVLTPEIVAYTAWHQRADARMLTTKMNFLLDNEPEMSQEASAQMQELQVGQIRKRYHRTHMWTDIHSFHAIMGGLHSTRVTSHLKRNSFQEAATERP